MDILNKVFLLTAGLSFALSSVVSATVNIDADNSNIQYVGRVNKSDPKKVAFDWSGVQIRTIFTGTSCKLRFEDSQNGIYYNVFIDNTATPVVIHSTSGGAATYTVATGLVSGNHDIVITRRVEGYCGDSRFVGFTLDDGSTLLAPPARPAARMEFIGDSWTCGYGNEGTPGASWTEATENNWLTYGPMVARNFGADYHIVAESGRGCYQNNDGSTSGAVPLLYQKTMNTSPTNDWNFSSWVPQLVCIYLYFNDWNWSTPPTQNQFETAYKNLVTTVRSKYAGAAVCCLYAEQHNEYTYRNAGTYIRNVVTQLNTAGDSKVHNIGMQFVLGSADMGTDYHPNVAGHQKVANDLIPRLAAFMGNTGINQQESRNIRIPTASASSNVLNGQIAISSLKPYPHEFANVSTLSFNADNPGMAHIKLFNARGALVLSKMLNVKTGTNVVRWNTEDLRQGHFASGTYTYRISIIQRP